MLKKPTTKKVKSTVVSGLQIAGGAALGEGVEGVLPISNPMHSKLAVLAIGAALSLAYNGPQKAGVQNAGVGMIVSKSLDLVQMAAKETITVDPQAGEVTQFGYRVLGLACPCDGTTYPMGVGSPQRTVRALTYENVYQDNTEDLGYAGA